MGTDEITVLPLLNFVRVVTYDENAGARCERCLTPEEAREHATALMAAAARVEHVARFRADIRVRGRSAQLGTVTGPCLNGETVPVRWDGLPAYELQVRVAALEIVE